jgi:predicted metal-dependent phosphotriesterase family hydrolase
MEKAIMTVTGPVSPDKLGMTLIHEHFTFHFKKLLPKMKAAGVTDEQIRNILVDNPRRFLGGA